jgi:hypothetical protein
MLALMLPLLLGVTGLVIDGGLLLATQRQAQNAADGGALAAAMRLYRGETTGEAVTAANAYVQSYNGLPGAPAPTVNIPPVSGPHAGNDHYAEVLVTYPRDNIFMRFLGVGPTQVVGARAVAGFEAEPNGEGAIVLDPQSRPGLSVQGGASLRVEGSVVVNSKAAGLDQYERWVDWGLQQYAATTSNNSVVQCSYMQIKGGVDTVANFRHIDGTPKCPLNCRAPIARDPMRLLPIPTPANVPSINDWTRIPPITVNAGTNKVFTPGVYENIQINQGATALFTPGVYIFSPTKPNQGLRMNGNCTVIGDGVLFYFTGSNYLDVGPGHWDTLDGHLDGPLPPTFGPDALPPPPDPGFNSVKFATMDCNATRAYVRLTGLSAPGNPFDRVMFFQRRRNMNDASIQGNAGSNVLLGGAIYAKWARFKLAGEGRFDAKFVVGSMQVSGLATVTILDEKNLGIANLVYLVE